MIPSVRALWSYNFILTLFFVLSLGGMVLALPPQVEEKALASSLDVQAIQERPSMLQMGLTPREGGMEMKMEKRKGGKSRTGGSSNSSNGENARMESGMELVGFVGIAVLGLVIWV